MCANGEGQCQTYGLWLPQPKPNNCSLPFCPSFSPQARNDFELRRLMELDPAFAGSAGPEEARRNSVHSYGVYIAFEHGHFGTF